jgi:hypothetical protein
MPLASEHRVTASITVLSRPELVWNVLCDFPRNAEWVENTLEVLHGDAVAALGATYTERARLSGVWTCELRWTVTAFEPPRRMQLQGEGARAIRDLGLEYVLEEVGDGSEVSSTYSYLPRFGPIGAALELVVRGNVVADQSRSLRTLSHVVEQGPGVGAS